MSKQPPGDAPFVEGLKAKEVQEIPLEEISEDATFQYRLKSATADLKASIRREGQREPIDLIGPKPYRIIDGFLRTAAIRSLGWTTIKAFHHRGMSEDEAHRLAFLKNVVRKDLSPIDKANAIYQAKRRGRTIESLASDLRISKRQMLRYEALLTFPPEIQKLLDKDRVSMAHARALAENRITDPGEWLKRIDSGLTAKQLSRELRKARGSRAATRKKIYLKKTKDSLRIYPFAVKRTSSVEERDMASAALQEGLDHICGWN